MLILLALLTVGYFAVVVWVLRGPEAAGGPRHRPRAPVSCPPRTCPRRPRSAGRRGGSAFTPYVDHGFAALDAYLSEGSAA